MLSDTTSAVNRSCVPARSSRSRVICVCVSKHERDGYNYTHRAHLSIIVADLVLRDIELLARLSELCLLLLELDAQPVHLGLCAAGRD
jgi:hypothetical protein